MIYGLFFVAAAIISHHVPSISYPPVVRVLELVAIAALLLPIVSLAIANPYARFAPFVTAFGAALGIVTAAWDC